MNNKKGTSYRWILLPILLSSVSVLAGEYGMEAISAADQATALTADDSGFLSDSQQVGNANLNYVGGNSRVGVGFDTELKGRVDGSHIFMQNEDSVTSGQGWLGINPTADGDQGEEILTGAGAKINHHWVSRDESGSPMHVNKVFGAYDQNEAKDKKVTAGYGQERENLFWSGHVSKGLSDKRVSGTDSYGNHIYEKAYDFGVGGRAGMFMHDQLLRVQGGLDYEWGSDTHSSEDTASQITVSGGVEKFFYDSPHSVGANVEVSQKGGGYVGDDHQADVSGNVSYRYDFGSAGLFASDEQYRRVRVEIPGETEVVKLKKKRPPKVERKLVKHTMELEADTFFKKSDHNLTSEAQQRLRTMIARIRQTGHHGPIRITGNTCDGGSHEYNQALSERRASSVRNFMAANGFNPGELQSRGLGETHPKYPNTDATRHKNRRVDIEYVSYQNNYKDEVVEQGYDIVEQTKVISEPRVVWRKELIPTPPSWVAQALRNNVQYKQSIGTYRTLGADANVGGDAIANTVPVANNDTIQTIVNTAVMLDVVLNDTDADGDALIVQSVDTTNTQHGTVTIDPATGKIMYTPEQGYVGTDTFDYVVIDDDGNTATATVTVTINTDDTGTNLVATDDKATTPQDTQVTIDVVNNDTDADNDVITIDVFQQTTDNGGTVTLQDGMLIYTPYQGFSGTDTFTYTITDGSHVATANVEVHVEAKAVNNPVDDSYTVAPADLDIYSQIALSVLDNDNYQGDVTIRIISQPTLGSIQNADGSGNVSDAYVQYQPNNDAQGTDSFTYVLVDSDGNQSEPAVVTINLPGVVTDPNTGQLDLNPDGTQGEVVGDTYSFYTNDTTPRTLDVLANDIGDGMRIISVSKPTPDRGTPQISADGKSIIYTLRHGECEDHYFEYTVEDQYGNTATEKVYINILDDNNVADTSGTDTGSESTPSGGDY